MKEIVKSVVVDGVWRLPSGKVNVSASLDDVTLMWQCSPKDAPRVGEVVAVRGVFHPPDKSTMQVLGLEP